MDGVHQHGGQDRGFLGRRSYWTGCTVSRTGFGEDSGGITAKSGVEVCFVALLCAIRHVCSSDDGKRECVMGYIGYGIYLGDVNAWCDVYVRGEGTSLIPRTCLWRHPHLLAIVGNGKWAGEWSEPQPPRRAGGRDTRHVCLFIFRFRVAPGHGHSHNGRHAFTIAGQLCL